MSEENFEEFEEAFDDLEFEEYEVEDMTESDLLKFLDKTENPLNLCQQLFKDSIQSIPLEYLTREQVIALRNQGYIIIDGFLDKLNARKIFEETICREKRGDLTLAHQFNPEDEFRDLKARNDLTMFINKEKESPIFTPLFDNYKVLMNDLNAVMNLNGFEEYQLAYYPPNENAHYERHRDGLPPIEGYEQGRKVTAICYISEKVNGGELKVFLPMSDEFIVIHPVVGRLVLFLSGAIDHEVCPVLDLPRVAFTSWIH
jgi:SM-20-related protein